MNTEKQNRSTFSIQFDRDHRSLATVISPGATAGEVLARFGLPSPRPVLFISGGAVEMAEEDRQRTYELVENGIVRFAEQYGLTIIDGGTDAGVMQMIGNARNEKRCSFPLIGIAPAHRVTYPGSPTNGERYPLNSGHSHFVLIDAEDFGDESQFIVDLTRAIAAGSLPMLGVLINGGKISEKDVYLATATGKPGERIPIVVLDGSGRKADEIATASRTGISSSSIVRAIVKGGDIRVMNVADGSAALYRLLHNVFTSRIR